MSLRPSADERLYAHGGAGMSSLLLGDTAPDFRSNTQNGPFAFHDWLDGSWAVLKSMMTEDEARKVITQNPCVAPALNPAWSVPERVRG